MGTLPYSDGRCGTATVEGWVTAEVSNRRRYNHAGSILVNPSIQNAGETGTGSTV